MQNLVSGEYVESTRIMWIELSVIRGIEPQNNLIYTRTLIAICGVKNEEVRCSHKRRVFSYVLVVDGKFTSGDCWYTFIVNTERRRSGYMEDTYGLRVLTERFQIYPDITVKIPVDGNVKKKPNVMENLDVLSGAEDRTQARL